MKIVIPYPATPDSFQDNVASTLRDMGHQVITPPVAPRRGPLAQLAGVGRDLAERAGVALLSPLDRWLLRAVRSIKVDMVLALTQQIAPEALRECRRATPHVVAWWGDAPAQMTRAGLFSHDWSAIFLKDGDAVRKFRNVGLNAHLLHEAMNPAWHRVIAESATRNAVAVVGNWYAYRQCLTARLLESGIEVDMYGPRLPRWAVPSLKARATNGYVVREEKSRVFGECVAALNSTQLCEGNSLNCRAFEIAGAGGVQLIEQRPVVEECFEPGRELFTYTGFDELLEHVEHIARDKALAGSVRRSAARRALAEHTYRHRLTRMFEVLLRE